MKSIPVTLSHGSPVVSTPIIAEMFGRQHGHVLRTVRKLIENGTISRSISGPRNYIDSRGKEQPCYELSERDFLVSMPFIGGRTAEQGQSRLVDEFLRTRNQIARAEKARATIEWQDSRTAGKLSRRAETDVIAEFVGYAKSQGSEHAGQYYNLLTKAVYSPLFQKPKGVKWAGVRDTLGTEQLILVATVERVVSAALTQGMEAGDHYKEIYRLAADRAKTIGRMLPKSEPALLGVNQ